MNILLVEDNEDWITLIKEDLVSGLKTTIPEIGNCITISKTFEESNIRLDNPKWNLIIVDICLSPNDDKNRFGLTLIRKAASKKIPIIIISDNIDESERKTLYQTAETKKYLKGHYSKRYYHTQINDCIEVVKKILLSARDLNKIFIDNYELEDNDLFDIAINLVKLAENSNNIENNNYFNQLVRQLKLPKQLENEIFNKWMDNAGINSIQLIKSVQHIDKNYQSNFRQVGITVLGNLIKIMLQAGGDSTLLSIIKNHNLITDTKIIANLEKLSEEISNQNTFVYDVFICYSSKDKQFIREKIIPEFKRQEIEYWFDAEQIKPVDRITEKIDEGLKDSRYIIACLSKNIFQSGWARAEFGAAINGELSGRRKRLIVVTVDDIDHDGIQKISNLLVDKIRHKCSSKVELDKLIEFLKGEG